MILRMFCICICPYHHQTIIIALNANITGYITNNAVFNFDDNKHISYELFYITFEVYNPDPLICCDF